MPVWPATIVKSSYNPNFVIPRIGRLSTSLKTAPFQPSNTSVKKYPRFHYFDCLGTYFGANGYYGSIPCWLPFQGFYTPYQAATFSINATGCFDCNSLLNDPFQLQSILPQPPLNITGVQYGGSLPFPYQHGQSLTVKNAFPTVSQGLGKLYLGQTQPLNSVQTPFTRVAAQTGNVIPWPSIQFEDVNVPFPHVLEPNFADLSGDQCKNGFASSTAVAFFRAWPSALIYDAISNSFIQGVQEISANAGIREGYNPCGNGAAYLDYDYGWFPANFTSANPGQIQPTAHPVTVTRQDGKTCAFLVPPGYFTAGSTKINPNGNFITYGWPSAQGSIYGPPAITSGVLIGNGLCEYEDSGTGTIYGNWIAKASLSDATDNTFFNNAYTTFQQFYGGFIAFITGTPIGANNPLFIILPDFSGYYRLDVSLPAAIASKSAFGELISIDLDGILYFIDGTTGALYWSGLDRNTILIPVPPLTQIGVSCDKFSDNPWSG